MALSDVFKDFKNETAALFKEAVTTTPSPRQEKIKKNLAVFYAILGNFFFMSLALSLIFLFLRQLLFWLLGQDSVQAVMDQVWGSHYALVLFYSLSIVLGFLTAVVVVLKLLLQLYRMVGIVELFKLYALGEFIWICVQYIFKPASDTPVLFVVDILRQFTKFN